MHPVRRGASALQRTSAPPAVDQMFLVVYPLGQAFDGVVRRHRYNSLYDQWAAIEFLSHEVYAAAMLGVACL